MDKFDCTNVKTSCRLYRNKQIMIFIKLTCNNCFLLVATRHRTCNCRSTLTTTYIKFINQCIVIR